eukprot:GILJ01035142.1.p1 GENE.GILJ01035142.1~~GILJ01035142.1.p1  ORF type:complete len:229 (-),score=37.39 GILJ01035142.1:8-694(-)
MVLLRHVAALLILGENQSKDDGLLTSLVNIAARYHDSGYPKALTVAYDMSNPSTKSILGRDHEKMSIFQLLDNIVQLQKTEADTVKFCLSTPNIFKMALLIQSTTLATAFFAAGDKAKQRAEALGKGADLPLRDKLRARVVAEQTCQIVKEWMDNAGDSSPLKLALDRHDAACGMAPTLEREDSGSQLPLDDTATTLMVTLAKADFANVHQPGGLCWAFNLLTEMLKK